MLIAYRILINLLYPFLIFIFLIRTFFNKEDKTRYKEKIFSKFFKIKKNHKKKLIWFHAASIGELNSILPVIEKLNDKENYEFLITTVTLSSANLIAKKNLDENIIHRFFPLDKSNLVNNFLDNWDPNLIIFVDSEIWPNFILEIKKRKIPLMLLNGRITKKTFKRWKFINSFASYIFQSFSVCFSSNEETKKHLEFFKVKNVKYLGNIKLAVESQESKLDNYNKKFLMEKKPWCAVSTHQSEEIFCLKTHLIVKSNLKEIITIIIPRHIHRSNSIKKECDSLNLKAQILDKNEKIKDDSEIIIINSYGAVSDYLNICKSVFIGKSMIKKLEAVGGQNPVEAAKLGCKIYHGPYIYNFQELYEFLSNKNFSEKIINEKELSQKIIRDFNENMKMSDSQVENINRIGKKILKDTCDEIQLLIN